MPPLLTVSEVGKDHSALGSVSAAIAGYYTRTADSGDCDQPFRPKVITDSGDRDHSMTPPTESARGPRRSAPSTRVEVA